MGKPKYYINKEHFEAEMGRHKNEVHPTVTYKPGGKKKGAFSGHEKPAPLDSIIGLAAILGIERQTLTSLKNDGGKKTRPCDLAYLQKLAAVWGCDWRYLAGEMNERTEDKEQAALNKQWHESLQEMQNKRVSDLEVTKCFFEVLGYKVTEKEDRVLMEKIHDCRSFFKPDKDGIYHEKLTKGTEWFISRKGFDKMCRSFQLCTVGILDELISLACSGDKLFLDELEALEKEERNK